MFQFFSSMDRGIVDLLSDVGKIKTESLLKGICDQLYTPPKKGLSFNSKRSIISGNLLMMLNLT